MPEPMSKITPAERVEENQECPDLMDQDDEESDSESEEVDDDAKEEDEQPLRHSERIRAVVTRPDRYASGDYTLYN
jgi:hypothetical protein